jgi:RNA polymerase sigma-70 factor (ECF subfamily)
LSDLVVQPVTGRNPRQIKEKDFDPLLRIARKRNMLMSNDHAEHLAETVGSQPLGFAFPNGAARRVDTVKPTDQTDLHWIACITAVAKDEDQAAFAELFRHFAPRVKAFLIKSGADESLAEECMQDVMATIWQKAHLFDATRASVATWIFTIARNRKIDLLRRYARPEPEDLPWGPEREPDQEDVLALQQDTEKLAEAIRQLPEKQRALIERAYFGDLTHSEIAAETGLPLGTIKSRIRLALERLRHAMN